MALYVKFSDFVEQLGKGVHQLHAAGHTLKVYLSNEQPLATDTVKADILEIDAEHGYPAGGLDIENDLTETGGVATMVGVDKEFIAVGGSFGPFRWAILCNSSVAGNPLVAWWDYGSEVTCKDGEKVTVDFQPIVFTLE